MNEKDIKKLIEKSEVNTSFNFTNKLMKEIETQNSLQTTITFWSVRQIVIGFVLVAVISSYLIYKVLELKISTGNVAVPFVWSLILLLGLNYLLSINNYKPITRLKN
jgi:hypothetical protein